MLRKWFEGFLYSWVLLLPAALYWPEWSSIHSNFAWPVMIAAATAGLIYSFGPEWNVPLRRQRFTRSSHTGAG